MQVIKKNRSQTINWNNNEATEFWQRINLIFNYFLQILFEIFDNLNKFQLKDLLIISKRLQPLVQFLLEHKKKIRLCGDHLRVLLLSLPHGFGKYYENSLYAMISKFIKEEVVLDNDVNYPGFKGNSVVGS